MDVMNPEQARIAEKAGACAVMALEKIPADIRAEKGVARSSFLLFPVSQFRVESLCVVLVKDATLL